MTYNQQLTSKFKQGVTCLGLGMTDEAKTVLEELQTLHGCKQKPKNSNEERQANREH